MSLRADSIRIVRMIALEGRAYTLGLLSLAAVNAADVLAPVFLAVALDLTEAHLAGTTVATPPLLRFVGLDAATFTIAGATLAFLALQVIANVFRYPMLMLVAVPSHAIGQRVRNSIIGQMLRLSRPFYDRSRSGDLMSLATNDVSAVRMMLGQAYSWAPTRLLSCSSWLACCSHSRGNSR
jgi:ATP-binding cassette subfamily B multidrug efflux pump